VPPLPEPIIAADLGEVPWRAREAIVVALLSLATGGFFTLIVTAVLTPHGTSSITPEQKNLLTLYATIIIEGSLGLWVWLWVRLRHRVGLEALGVRLRRGDIGAGILTALVGLAAAQVITQIVISITETTIGHPIRQPKQLPPGLHGAGQLTAAAIAVILVAPFAEELFFRGFLYQAFRRWRGVTQAILLSAAVFALSHGAPLLIVGIFPLGIVLAYMFERKGSLVVTITAHMTYNLIGFIFLVTISR